MRKMLTTIALAALAFGLTTSAASAAAQCPPGQVLDCKPQAAPSKPGVPQPCRCIKTGTGTSKPLDKKNVPQFKKNTGPR